MNATTISAWENYVSRRFGEMKLDFPDSIATDDPRLLAIQMAFQDWHGRKVLDLGCGRGRYEKHFQTWGADYFGLDISRDFMETDRFRQNRVVGSALRLPFETNAFDAILIAETLQHSPLPILALKNAIHCVKSGGALVVIERNPFALSSAWPLIPALLIKKIDEYRGRWMYPSDAPVREKWLSPQTILNYFKKDNLEYHLQFMLSNEQHSTLPQVKIKHFRPFYALTIWKK
jgi:SAM-dependent methyltransferase